MLSEDGGALNGMDPLEDRGPSLTRLEYHKGTQFRISSMNLREALAKQETRDP